MNDIITDGYLNTTKVIENGNDKQTLDQHIKTTCYDKGIYWVCPDPKDIERCKLDETRYNKGLYINKRIFWLNEIQYKEYGGRL